MPGRNHFVSVNSIFQTTDVFCINEIIDQICRNFLEYSNLASTFPGSSFYCSLPSSVTYILTVLCLLHSILDVGVDVDQGCEMSKQDLFKIFKSKIGRDSESEVCLFLRIVQMMYLGQYYFSSNISKANIFISLYCANGVPRPPSVPREAPSDATCYSLLNCRGLVIQSSSTSFSSNRPRLAFVQPAR